MAGKVRTCTFLHKTRRPRRVEWWYCGVGLDQSNCSTPGPVSTGMGDRLRGVCTISVRFCSQQSRSTQPSTLRRTVLSLRTFAHLTVLSLSNPALNLTFSLLPITSSHPHASASDSTFDYWRYINIWLTLIDIDIVNEYQHSSRVLVTNVHGGCE